MLSPDEFTVGTFANVAPLTLILPRTQYDETMLIGQIENAPFAVILSGQHAFQYLATNELSEWVGLIVPNVRVEVDETSVFEPQRSTALGTAIRTDTRLGVKAKSEESSRSSTLVTLHDGLASTGESKAGFSVWQVVIGHASEKRVLWRTPGQEK